MDIRALEELYNIDESFGVFFRKKNGKSDLYPEVFKDSHDVPEQGVLRPRRRVLETA